MDSSGAVQRARVETATTCLKDEELTPLQPFIENLFYKVLRTEPLHD